MIGAFSKSQKRSGSMDDDFDSPPPLGETAKLRSSPQPIQDSVSDTNSDIVLVDHDDQFATADEEKEVDDKKVISVFKSRPVHFTDNSKKRVFSTSDDSNTENGQNDHSTHDVHDGVDARPSSTTQKYPSLERLEADSSRESQTSSKAQPPNKGKGKAVRLDSDPESEDESTHYQFQKSKKASSVDSQDDFKHVFGNKNRASISYQKEGMEEKSERRCIS
jgi:hypothetical protein